MKKFWVLPTLLIFMVACNSTPEGYVLKGELRGSVKDSTKVFLKKTDSLRRTMLEVDTVLVNNGEFTFAGSIDAPELYYIFIDGIRANAPVILENGEVQFKAQIDSLSMARIKGTPQNDMFMTYLDELRTFNDMSRSMNAEFRKANVSKDTVSAMALRDEYLELQERAKNYDLEFVKEYPESLISVMVLEKLLSAKTVPVKEIDSIFSGISAEIKATDSGKRVAKQLETAKAAAIGTAAPVFSGPQPDGTSLALNDIKGKVTLIDFWAAWCKPCRMENPNIVAVYNKYKDKGLQVVGVSLDRKREDWLRAIEKDKLSWNHVSNLQYFNDPIAKLYNVNAIPAAFLLDENGIIIAKNLRGQQLEQKVAELLN